jgi:hypothetical protein
MCQRALLFACGRSTQYFDMEIGKLRPDDRPPEICELDNSDLIRQIEAEFGVTITDSDLENIDGSFRSIVRYLSIQHSATPTPGDS